MALRLKTAVAAILLTLAPGPSSFADKVAAQRDGVEFRQISENVWLHTSYTDLPIWGRFPANGLIVAAGREAILIDSGWTDADASAVLDWATNEADLDITKAYFTHSHVDKMGGVGAIRARGIATYALELSNRLAVMQGLTPAEFAIPLEEGAEAIFDGPVEIFYPGPAHSPDNIVINVEGAGILFGGCLVRPPNSRSLGNISDASVGHWAEAVEAIASAFPSSRVVVPTHGPPGGRELLDLTTRLVQAATSE